MPADEVNIENRIRQLALVCELDRLSLKLALKPAPQRGLTIAGLPAAAIGRALSFTQYFPGVVGRVARGVAVGSSIARLVKPLFSLRSKLTTYDTHHEPISKSTNHQ